MTEKDIMSAVNSLSYRPPSLILSQDSSQSNLDNQWRLNDHILQDSSSHSISTQASATTTATNPATTPNKPTSDDLSNLSNSHVLHSRDSSTSSVSTTAFSQKLETPSNHRGGLNAPLSPDSMINNMSAERPHSFSGGLSQSDLRRLQNLPTKGQPPSPVSTYTRLDGPRTSPPRENLADVWADSKNVQTTPPRFPTLVDQPTTAFPSLHAGSGYQAINPSPTGSRADFLNLNDDFQHMHPRGLPTSPYDVARLSDSQYRLPVRTTVPASYASQSMLQTSSPYMYASQPRPPPLERTQAAFALSQQPYYDMINSPPLPTTALRRDAQLVNHRGNMSASSPVYSPGLPTATLENSLRNPVGLPLLNGVATMGYLGMPTGGMYTPPPHSTSPIGTNFTGFPTANQPYYAHSPSFNSADALAEAMGRLNVSPSTMTGASNANFDAESVSSNQTGPSANNRKLGLYKTELCRSWEEKGSCRYGAKCQFAHSDTEVRRVSRHPKYKTEICRTFWVSGSCPYGKRCCFIHTELPASGTPPGADGSSPPKLTTGITGENSMLGGNRDRSPSNSGGVGESQPISLLQRISAQRDSILSPSSDSLSPANYQFAKPSTGTLRLDTSSLPGKTNYPLTSNPTLTSSDLQTNGMSPILPATAGPDFGRQTAARVEVVGYNGGTPHGLVGNKPSTRDSNLRHSFNGTEMGLSINSPVSSGPSGLTPITPESATAETPTGHQRAGSAGQWPTGSLNSRNGNSNTHLTSASSFMPNHVTSNERNSPWGLPELSNPTTRKRLSGTWL